MQITKNILDKLKLDWTFIIKKKHGNSPQLFLGQFLEAILKYNRAIDTCIYLNISPQTFNRTIKKVFPKVKLQGGNETWTQYLIKISDYKYCSNCKFLQKKVNFTKDISCADNLDRKCKNCKRKLVNKQYYKQYYKDNKETYIKLGRKHNAKRRAAIIHRTPNWANVLEIAEIYDNCPNKHHVDHIIPLQGKLVSGLHVENNLQYLTENENLSKSNKFSIK